MLPPGVRAGAAVGEEVEGVLLAVLFTSDCGGLVDCCSLEPKGDKLEFVVGIVVAAVVDVVVAVVSSSGAGVVVVLTKRSIRACFLPVTLSPRARSSSFNSLKLRRPKSSAGNGARAAQQQKKVE